MIKKKTKKLPLIKAKLQKETNVSNPISSLPLLPAQLFNSWGTKN
jgi:hypothetical protein